MSYRHLLAAGLLAAALPGLAAELPETIRSRARDAGIPEDSIAFVVQRMDGTTIASHNAERSLQPASTIKLLTSLVALETLGPAYRGSAEMRVRAAPVDGVLHGNLVLRGFGDVDLDTSAFERMLVALRAAGVREIRGDLLLDRTYYEPARTDLGLPPFDEAPEFRYNFVPDALMLGTSLMRLELAADDKGVLALLGTPLDGVVVTAAEMKLNGKSCEDWEDDWKHPVVRNSNGLVEIRLQGEFPRRCAASTEIHVIERTAYADRLFRALWRRNGGTFAGKVRDGSDAEAATILASHRSRPFSLVIHDINKRSDNPITRVTFLTLGAFRPYGVIAPTAQRADALVREWMKERGISDEGLVLENGSGLSRKERIKASQLAAVLQAAAKSVWAAEFTASLPIAGIDGGSMRTRLRGISVGEGTRFKTGTLNNTSAMAGYLRTPTGETRIVVVIANHERATKSVARPLIDAIIEWAATLK
jgi:D-alanyl-D-alanine carboxypeptidase/D-alanyl-D-alanine-endopeptidase (penicillin-binding protein 4)